MNRIYRILIWLPTAWLLTSCSVNILTEFSDPTTNEALLFDAKQLINEGNYSSALAKISSMSGDYQAKREVKVLSASAYLGLCSGIDFLDLIAALGNLGSLRVMEWLLNTFQGGNAPRQAACLSAEAQIKSIALYGANRTSDENLLMAFISFAKMGAILSRFGDSGTPDGAVDAGFDPCQAGQLPQAETREVATGFLIAIDALENIGSSQIGSSALTSATNACSQLPPMSTLCSAPAQVNVGDIDALEERGIRSLINESQDLGLGTCTGDAFSCACP